MSDSGQVSLFIADTYLEQGAYDGTGRAEAGVGYGMLRSALDGMSYLWAPAAQMYNRAVVLGRTSAGDDPGTHKLVLARALNNLGVINMHLAKGVQDAPVYGVPGVDEDPWPGTVQPLRRARKAFDEALNLLQVTSVSGHAVEDETLAGVRANLDFFTEIIAAFVVNASTGNNTLLMQWSAAGDAPRVGDLLAQGENVNAVDRDGDTALYYALSNQNFSIVEALLSGGADPNIAGTSGSLLGAAADQGWDDPVRTLIHHHADVNHRETKQGVHGVTAVMLAAGAGRDETVALLAGHGADINATDADGDPVLTYAVSRGHVSTVRVLLSLGANRNPRPNNHGQTPLVIAQMGAQPSQRRPPGTTGGDYQQIVTALTAEGIQGTPSIKKPPTGEIMPQAPTCIEIHGSTQTGLPGRRTIKVYWNGKKVGMVTPGGRFTFETTSAGQVMFKSMLRIATVDVSAGGLTKISLLWDSATGEIVPQVRENSATAR